jgi:hypothetical protein
LILLSLMTAATFLTVPLPSVSLLSFLTSLFLLFTWYADWKRETSVAYNSVRFSGLHGMLVWWEFEESRGNAPSDSKKHRG